MYVGGCEVWGSGFGRWASPILTVTMIYIYINITMVNGVIIQLVTYNLWFIDSSSL